MCAARDTGPNHGPCQNKATTRNSLGMPVCPSCAALSARVDELAARSAANLRRLGYAVDAPADRIRDN